jgi:hypothetical protein
VQLRRSVLDIARRQRGTGTAPLVMNLQGLEEFSATDPSRATPAPRTPAAQGGPHLRGRGGAVIATDRSLSRRAATPGIPAIA